MAIRFVIHVDSGRQAGQRRLLRPMQALTVGRNDYADLAIPDDRLMSNRHFNVSTDQEACYLEDLGSSNGTMVNGQKVPRCLLRDGDIVNAGQTQFRMEIQGVSDQVLAKKTAKIGEQAALQLHASFTARHSDSGVFIYTGSTEALPPELLAEKLGGVLELSLLLDPKQAGDKTFQTLPPELYLFGWLPEETRHLASPVCLNSDDPLPRKPLIGQHWGKDALVLVYSEKDEPVPREHIGLNAGTLLRPSLVRPQLGMTKPTVTENVMIELEAVLVEGEEAGTWEIFSRQDISATLEAIGLLPVAEPKPAATTAS